MNLKFQNLNHKQKRYNRWIQLNQDKSGGTESQIPVMPDQANVGSKEVVTILINKNYEIETINLYEKIENHIIDHNRPKTICYLMNIYNFNCK